MTQKQIEWLASLSGLCGSGLVAANLPISGWGFVVFLISNAFWIAFAVRGKHWGLLTMQAGFTVTSTLGVFRWLLV